MEMRWAAGYQGARWVRADLHLHSPGAHSFTFPPGMDAHQRDAVVGEYVARLKAQGVRVAAITDYQQIRTAWFHALRRTALEEDIYIYPGVELSFGGGAGGKAGLHVLAIFPFTAEIEGINRTIHTLLDGEPGRPLVREDGRHRDLKPRESLGTSLRQLRQQTGCLLIFPHPNGSKGLFKSFTAGQAAEIVEAVYPEAIEDLSERDRQRLLSTGKIAEEKLNRIAPVHFSDNHSVREIGSGHLRNGSACATYLKLSVPDDLLALRLAFRDHEILAHVGERPEVTHTRLEMVEVEGRGFLGELRLALSPDLNVLIGGRGVGKSALLEVIRYGLDLPRYSPTEYREGLVRHALGSGGKVTLHLRQVVRPGVERHYRIERVLGEEAQVYELDAAGEHLVALSAPDVLSCQEIPLFFGQRELYEIAQSSRLRRELLDELLGHTARRKLREVERLRQTLWRNARRLLELQAQRSRREEVEQRLREIEHELRLFEQHGVADKLREETALTRDAARLERTEAIPPAFLEAWQVLRKEWQERLQTALADLSQAESRQKALLQEEAAQVIRALQAGLVNLFGQGRTLLREAEEGLAAVRQRWDEERRAVDAELRRIRQALGTQTLDPDRLIHLTGEKARLEQEVQWLRRVEAEAQALEDERRQLLQKLREVRREAFRLRDERAREITRQIARRVKVEVQYRGQRKEFAEALAHFFSGSGIRKASLEALARNEAIADGLALAALTREGLAALVEKTGLSEAQARRLLDFLAQDEARRYELELLSPEDEVNISLKVNEHWVELEKLSAGQRATALLLILLTREQHSLIIDQPEDDLDNRFIYEEVVKLLRAQKERRQCVIATHNPNIPVLAHAELIAALEADSERAHIVVQGGMDRAEVRHQVRRVMEGGEEAFRRRAEKYGWYEEAGHGLA